MDILDYAERETERTMAVLRHGYDDLHERAYKLAALLVAGGGAIGAYALGRVGGEAPAVSWAPLAGLALSWLGTAAVLVWRGTVTRELSPGNGPRNLLGYFDGRFAECGDTVQALATTRRAELAVQQRRIAEYRDGCEQRAQAIDTAYKAAAICSPLVPAIIAAACLMTA